MTPEIVSLDDLDATPHAVLFDGEPRTIRLSLAAGEEIAAHSHPDRQIAFHLLTGSMAVTLDDDVYELDAGDVARFDGTRSISPRAQSDSTALLVLSPRASE